MLLFPRTIQIEKKASRLSGKAVPLVSSGVAPSSDSPSLRTSTFKRFVKNLAIGGTEVLITTAVPIARVFLAASVLASKPRFIPIEPFADLGDSYCLFSHSTPGPSRRPSWKRRSLRHDWRISLGYGQGTRSRSCWTCMGTSRHSSLVDNG